MSAELLGFPSGELGPAVISRIGFKPEITMKTLILAAIRCSLMFTAVAALSVVYPASVQAVPTTYEYTGKPFTEVSGPYTTSDFVSGRLTLASPLGPNFFGFVFPTAFSFSDGVQTITNLNSGPQTDFVLMTGPAGAIINWSFTVVASGGNNFIFGTLVDHNTTGDGGVQIDVGAGFGGRPGRWTTVVSIPDTGSTLSLMTLTLMALGVAARRRLKRAAA
jgi:hypothetical protein